MNKPFDLDDIVRRWRLGYLDSRDLPEIAYRALEAGLETPFLYELAGLDRPSMREARPIFKRALEDLGRFSSTIEEQPLWFAVDLAQRILSREIGLVAGCREMVTIRHLGNMYDCRALYPFVGVESETDTLPLGEVRDRWSAEALREVDERITQAEVFYRDLIDAACRALIAEAGTKGK